MHRSLENGVHEFRFLEPTRDAVDEWANHLEQLQLQGHWYGRETVRLILDTRQSGSLPIRYLFECLSDYNREYAHLKPPKVRIAYVHAPSQIILPIFSTFADLMPVPTKARFFEADAYDQALAWLHSEE